MFDYIADYLENICDWQNFPDVRPDHMRELISDSVPIDVEKFENISSEPIHNYDITEETLEIAANLYFTVLTCPFQNSKISWILYFYKNLFERQSLETALKTLARILYVMVNENNNKVYQYEEYNIAKALFDKLTSVFNLRNRDIAMMTTAASELELYHGKKNFTSNTNITRKSKDNQNKLS